MAQTMKRDWTIKTGGQSNLNTASSTSGLLRSLILRLTLAAALLTGFCESNAFAQSERVLECGARIVSNQPFGGTGGDRLCLFVQTTNDRERVALRPCTMETARQNFLWKIVRRDGGGLFIISAMDIDRERRMEVADFGKDNGAAIQIWGANVGNGYRSQTWDFFPATNGVMIISVDSGKCLNVPLGRNRLDQEVLQQFTCERRPNDTWQIESVLPLHEHCR